MTDLQQVLILVFDGGKARFFRFKADGLHPAAEMESGLHRFAREAVSDKPGRSFQSAGGGMRHAMEPRHDPHKQEKHDFVHRLVDLLDDAYDQLAFRHLVVVAPERSLGEFREIASAKLRNTVVKEVGKELTQYSLPELEERLRPVLTEVGAAPAR
jgi:protein required for attachment to host cells